MKKLKVVGADGKAPGSEFGTIHDLASRINERIDQLKQIQNVNSEDIQEIQVMASNDGRRYDALIIYVGR